MIPVARFAGLHPFLMVPGAYAPGFMLSPASRPEKVFSRLKNNGTMVPSDLSRHLLNWLVA
jgi:hypothetical protein